MTNQFAKKISELVSDVGGFDNFAPKWNSFWTNYIFITIFALDFGLLLNKRFFLCSRSSEYEGQNGIVDVGR